MKTLTGIQRFLQATLIGSIAFASSSIQAAQLPVEDPPPTQATTKKPTVPPIGTAPALKDLRDVLSSFRYVYTSSSAEDPFKPSIKEPTQQQVVPDDDVSRKAQLTGLQLFTPSSLTYSATFKSAHGTAALVEDPTGRGYVIHLGTEVDEWAVVTGIYDNAICLLYRTPTKAGKVKVRADIIKSNVKSEALLPACPLTVAAASSASNRN